MSDALTTAFQSVGKEYGYYSVSADFIPSKEFKIKWRRSCGWIELEVSDYLVRREVGRKIAKTRTCGIARPSVRS